MLVVGDQVETEVMVDSHGAVVRAGQAAMELVAVDSGDHQVNLFSDVCADLFYFTIKFGS